VIQEKRRSFKLRRIITRRLQIFSIAFSLGLLVSPGFAQEKHHQLTDVSIKSAVEHKLEQAGLQRRGEIAVSVEDAVVTIRGKVRSLAQKRRAEKAARAAEDVTRVENELAVEAGDRTDQEIARELTREIRGFAFFDFFDRVEGEVNNGLVTLRGEVREPWRRDDYVHLAEAVPGVKEVKNELRALPVSNYDDQLRITAARQLYGDPRFVRHANRSLPPIHIVVENGRVSLKGAVTAPLEKRLTDSLVSSGVLSFQVQNDLTVDSEVGKQAARQ
jgi:hyperosmotically inducible protein